MSFRMVAGDTWKLYLTIIVFEPTGSAVSMKCFTIAFNTFCRRGSVILYGLVVWEFSTANCIVLVWIWQGERSCGVLVAMG